MSVLYSIKQNILKYKKAYVTHKDIAAIYDKLNKDHSPSKGKMLLENYEKIFSYTSLDKNAKILEIGCGDGFFTNIIPPDSKYLGIDISTKMISEALKQNKENRNNVFYEKVDAKEFIKYASKNSYDLIVFSFSWKYFDSNFTNKINDLLKKDGCLIIIDDFKENFTTLFELYEEFKLLHYKDIMKINTFTNYSKNTDELNYNMNSLGFLQTVVLKFDKTIDSQEKYLTNSGIISELVSEFGSASELYNKNFLSFIKERSYLLPKQKFFISIAKK